MFNIQFGKLLISDSTDDVITYNDQVFAKMLLCFWWRI